MVRNANSNCPASAATNISIRIFGYMLYFVFAGASYFFIFDHDTKEHPKYLKNQVWLEIKQSVTSVPFMAIMTAPCFWLEVQGYSKLYDATEDGPGLWYNYAQFPIFIMFTDCFIYFIHRGLHHPWVYKTLHKPHHKWIMPTPFASHAFNPIDGFAQSVPYHVFPFILPLQKWAYVALFVFINIWTIMIHDGEFVTDNPVINGAACHSTHHLAFNYNYGQFTTLWDRLGGTYRAPGKDNFKSTLKKTDKEIINQQVATMEKAVVELEGVDDRSYLPDSKAKKVQ
jgi:lathosterol oxidase